MKAHRKLSALGLAGTLLAALLTACGGPPTGHETRIDAHSIAGLAPGEQYEASLEEGVLLSWEAGPLDYERIRLHLPGGSVIGASKLLEDAASQGAIDLAKPPRTFLLRLPEEGAIGQTSRDLINSPGMSIVPAGLCWYYATGCAYGGNLQGSSSYTCVTISVLGPCG